MAARTRASTKLFVVFAIAFGGAALVSAPASAGDGGFAVSPAIYRVDKTTAVGPPVQLVYQRGGYYYGGGGGWGYRGYGYGPYYRRSVFAPPVVQFGSPTYGYPLYGYGYPAYGYGYPAYGYGYPAYGYPAYGYGYPAYGYGPRVSVGVGVW
jgi:hypothetical protein